VIDSIVPSKEEKSVLQDDAYRIDELKSRVFYIINGPDSINSVILFENENIMITFTKKFSIRNGHKHI